jgi:hypothetical protein
MVWKAKGKNSTTVLHLRKTGDCINEVLEAADIG